MDSDKLIAAATALADLNAQLTMARAESERLFQAARDAEERVAALTRRRIHVEVVDLRTAIYPDGADEFRFACGCDEVCRKDAAKPILVVDAPASRESIPTRTVDLG